MRRGVLEAFDDYPGGSAFVLRRRLIRKRSPRTATRITAAIPPRATTLETGARVAKGEAYGAPIGFPISSVRFPASRTSKLVPSGNGSEGTYRNAVLLFAHVNAPLPERHVLPRAMTENASSVE